MKVLKLLPFVLLVSCKSYMEYTAGINEIDYSFRGAPIKRYHNMEAALKHPYKVVFLDLSFASAKNAVHEYTLLNENIEKFPYLKKLTLEGNDSLPVPENLFNIKDLEFLALNSFRDTTGMSRLNELQNLRFLSLDFCELNHVPASVMQLKKLQGLDLTGNEISRLPEEFSGLQELITLDLTNNLFTEIPPVLKQNHKLKYLDMNNAEGTNLDRLSTYHVGVNRIKYVPDLKEFRGLKELYVTFAYDAVDSLNREYAHVKVR